MTTVSLPMIAGPTMRLPVIVAPFSILTRPTISLLSSADPSQTASTLSSTRRLTSSMSVTLPVSFQYPEIMVERTSWPLSISHWIACVISNSPRQEGSMERTASWTAGVKR